MEKILDKSQSDNVLEVVLTAIEESGFTAEEAIPGLMSAVQSLALETSDPDQALNEAVKEIE